MRPADVLKQKFRDYLLAQPGGRHCQDHEFRHTMTYQFWWELFLAGANAAMDMQFEPGAVRFGETPPPDTPLTNPFHPDAKWGPPKNYTAQYVPPPPHDLGGEGG